VCTKLFVTSRAFAMLFLKITMTIDSESVMRVLKITGECIDASATIPSDRDEVLLYFRVAQDSCDKRAFCATRNAYVQRTSRIDDAWSQWTPSASGDNETLQRPRLTIFRKSRTRGRKKSHFTRACSLKLAPSSSLIHPGDPGMERARALRVN